MKNVDIPPGAFRQARIKDHLILRSRLIQTIRNFFAIQNFLEVETPLRIPAPAPEIHIDAQGSDGWFLQASPELCMKRLLAAGYPRIYQICRCFRRMERGDRHLPEFTLLEWYAAGWNYRDMMAHCEEMIGFAARELTGISALNFQGRRIDLESPWDRICVSEAFERFGSISMESALAGDRFDEIMGLEIEPCLGLEKPVFLYDYPARCGALARLKPENPDLSERFELYISGIELCNAFSELVDPIEQRRRFEKERRLRARMGKDDYPLSEKFLEALEFMPPAAGNALGLDRLAMLFADAPDIDSVTAFTPEEL